MTMNLMLLMATSKTSTLPPIEENQDPKYKHSNTNKVFYFHNFAGQVFPRARRPHVHGTVSKRRKHLRNSVSRVRLLFGFNT
jgi:hypothetical protein